MFDEDKWYTIKEVHKKTGINIQTLYKRLYSEKIPVKLVGGVYKLLGENAPILTIAKKRGRKTVKANLVG